VTQCKPDVAALTDEQLEERARAAWRSINAGPLPGWTMVALMQAIAGAFAAGRASLPVPADEPKCARCDDTGCPVCDPEWAQHQVAVPNSAPVPYVAALIAGLQRIAYYLDLLPDHVYSDDRNHVMHSRSAHTLVTQAAAALQSQADMLAAATANMERFRDAGIAAEARVAELERALERIVGMCDAPTKCVCGRPNGLGAVVHCASAAIAASKVPPLQINEQTR